jgi:hypothetical protein
MVQPLLCINRFLNLTSEQYAMLKRRELNVPREVRFKKQYKPVGFGDRPDPGTVEGHLNAKA